ncbi:enoyl-CoA delta-isomerase 2 [Aureococcus anophagefferens]|nr:enoyl-CoA delta-isomerase 2 [Aureococcus anophagefferens]
MLLSVHTQFVDAAQDDAVKAVILTGAGDYYCAGVDLASSLTPMMPAALHEMIYRSNKKVFDTFLDFPKPLCVAVNGPNIGAAVTTATLADGVVASERATFSTPFARLGVTPEGCSSVHFEYLMGAEHAARMLGDEGWAPTGAEAAAAGLVDRCVPHDELLDAADAAHRGFADTAALKAVNERESRDLADAFLSTKFLRAQADFLSSKGKTRPALAFKVLIATRPAWSLLLP